MIDERTLAVRAIREEAKKLRLACIEAAGTAALFHIVFDPDMIPDLPIDHAMLLNRLGGLQ